MTMADMTEGFRLSRVYAQGWNAGAKSAAAPNPYAADPERKRWSEGFGDARKGAEDS
jgi:hypothetical protein